MKFFTILLGLFLSYSSYAVEIKLSFASSYKKGAITKVNHTEAIATLGKEFIMPSEGGNPFKFKMKVSENHKNEVEIEGHFFDSSNNIVASPKVITSYGQEATLTSATKDDLFSLKITATKH